MIAPNFADKTIWTGDNLDILRGMNSECVDLIYLDPPFNSNRDYAAPVGSKAAGAAFKDTWTLSDLDVAWMGLIADEQPGVYSVLQAAGRTHGKGMQSYLCMMAVRLMEMRRVLKNTGSIYLHCDPTAGHYLKLLMDAIFGDQNFCNEIIWHYRKWPTGKFTFQRNHDIILFYSRSQTRDRVFNQLYMDRAPSTIKRFGMAQIVSGHDESGQRIPSQVESNESRGVRQDDVWEIGRVAPIKQLFPTQKPLALVERIIKASSNPRDVVLDPFCGCATACVAAEVLGRQWVGIDLSPMAYTLVRQRLFKEVAVGAEEQVHFMGRQVTHRTDIPKRTDIEAPIPYRQNKHILFGQQEGLCNGCKGDFPFKLFEVDHIVPQKRGGTDHLENLQLLCTNCNRVKGDRPQEYLMARLKEMEG